MKIILNLQLHFLLALLLLVFIFDIVMASGDVDPMLISQWELGEMAKGNLIDPCI